MKQEKNMDNPEYSLRGVMPDYINFIFVFILGYALDWRGSNITSILLVELLLIIIFFALASIYNAFQNFLTNPGQRLFDIMFCVILSISFTGVLLSLSHANIAENNLISLAYLPSALYAHRKIFKTSRRFDSSSNDMFVTVLLGFLCLICLGTLMALSFILNRAEISNEASFITCYSILYFPYRTTLNILTSPKTKEKIHRFISDPENFFYVIYIVGALMFLFLGCYVYWQSNGESGIAPILIPVGLLGFGFFMVYSVNK